MEVQKVHLPLPGESHPQWLATPSSGTPTYVNHTKDRWTLNVVMLIS